MQKIPGSEVYQLFIELKNDISRHEQWGQSVYFKPAYDMLLRLQRRYNKEHNLNVKFLESDNVEQFKKYLKVSSYLEVQDFWSHYEKGRYTYELIPIPKYKRVIYNHTSHTRSEEKMYYRLSFPQYLNDFKYRHNITDHDTCRFCKKETESIKHIIMECEQLDYNHLKYECTKHNIEYNVKNVLLNDKIKYEVEKFLGKNFGGKF